MVLKLRIELKAAAWLIAALFIPLETMGQTVATWTNGAADMNWQTGTNWTGGTAPNGSGASATFAGAGSPETISLHGMTTTVGNLTISGGEYTIGDGTVIFNFNAASGNAVINISSTAGSQELNVFQSTLSKPLIFTNSSGLPFNYTGRFIINGNNLTIAEGELDYNGTDTSDNMGGGLIIDSGGTLKSSGQEMSFAGLSGAGNLILDGSFFNTGPTNATGSKTFSGAISGTSAGGAVFQVSTLGASTTSSQILSGVNDFSFIDIQIDTGTLALASPHAIDNLGNITMGEDAGPPVLSVIDNTTVIYDGSITLDDNSTITVTSGSSFSVNGGIGEGISGANLTVNGGGTLTLGAPSTYTGITILEAGILSIGDDSAIGGLLEFEGNSTLQFNLSLTSASNSEINDGIVATIDTEANTCEISGTIVDTTTGGILNKIGTGTLTLSGMNTYSGGTTITEGTLSIGDVSNLGAGNVTFAGDGTLLFNTAISNFTPFIFINDGITATVEVSTVMQSTISGLITDSTAGGIFEKSGSRFLALTAANTYSGGTLISDGTLVINDPTNLGSGTVTFTGDSALTFNNALTFNLPISIASGITGTLNMSTAANSSVVSSISDQTSGGILEKGGTGVLTLGGANTYTGGTQITGGTLQAGVANTIPSTGVVNVGASSIFDLNNRNQTIGNLSGVSSAQVNLGTATLTVGDNSNQEYQGSLVGTGRLTKTGSGILTLSNASVDYSGNTAVDAGRLNVNGTLTSSAVTVNSGGTLGGTGTVSQSVTSAGGTVAPGASPGILTVGSYSPNPNAITLIEITPTTASELIVMGTADLNGSVQVLQDAGSYSPSFSYPSPILQAGTIMNSFNPTVLGGMPGYHFTLTQMGNEVFLSYTFAPIDISTDGLSGNTLSFANYLNNNSPAAKAALAGLSGAALKKALNSASPARNAFGTFIAQNISLGTSQLISSHLVDQRFFRTRRNNEPTVAALFENYEGTGLAADAASSRFSRVPCASSSFWIGGFGEYDHLKALDQNPAFNAYSGASLIGFDYYGDSKNLFGFGAGYAYTHLIEDRDAGHQKINYYIGTLYDTVMFERGYLEFGAWGVYNQIHNYRNISFTGFEATASATIRDWQVVPHFGFGIHNGCDWPVELFGQLDCAIVWQQSYQERGASFFDMKVQSQTSELLRSEAGLRCYQTQETNWGAWMVMEKGSYVNKKAFGSGSVMASIVGTSALFGVESFTNDQSLGCAGFEFLCRWGKSKPITFSINYNGEFGSQYMSQEGMVRLIKDF